MRARYQLWWSLQPPPSLASSGLLFPFLPTTGPTQPHSASTATPSAALPVGTPPCVKVPHAHTPAHCNGTSKPAPAQWQ